MKCIHINEIKTSGSERSKMRIHEWVWSWSIRITSASIEWNIGCLMRLGRPVWAVIQSFLKCPMAFWNIWSASICSLVPDIAQLAFLYLYVFLNMVRQSNAHKLLRVIANMYALKLAWGLSLSNHTGTVHSEKREMHFLQLHKVHMHTPAFTSKSHILCSRVDQD